MKTKPQRIAQKRLKRRVIAKNHIKAEREERKRWLNIQEGKAKSPKKEKVEKITKPYRLPKLQKKHDALYQGVRALDHADPKRAKLLVRLSEVKRKLTN